MTLDEAVEEFEARLSVSDLVGYQRPKDGTIDPARAPNGDAYVLISSGGEMRAGWPFPAWFSEESQAVREWLGNAWLYQEERGGSVLYWNGRPELVGLDFVPVNQAAVIADPKLRGNVAVQLFCVVASMCIEKGKIENA